MRLKRSKKLALLLIVAMVIQGFPDSLLADFGIFSANGNHGNMTVYAEDPTGSPTLSPSVSPSPSDSPTPTPDPTETPAPTPTPMPEAHPSPWPDGTDVVFFMTYNSQQIVDGAILDMDSKGWASLGVANSAGLWPDGASIRWTSYDRNIIEIVEQGVEGDIVSSKYASVVRAIGPGYTDLEAVITYGGYEYRISCQLHVPLELQATSTSNKINHSTRDLYGMIDSLIYADTSNAKTIQLSTDANVGMTHYLPLFKHVKYADGVNSESPAGVLITTMPELDWGTSDETVVRVDEYGYITAVSAGYAEVTVTTRTKAANGTNESKTFGVLVSPAVNYDLITGIEPDPALHGWQSDIAVTASSENVTFIINANQNHADDLNWSLYKDSRRESNRLDIDDNPYMKVDISNTGNGVSLSGLKAGVYYLVAWPGEFSETNNKVNKLVIKIVVPLMINLDPIIMNVGDYYDLLQNVNIINPNLFHWDLKFAENGRDALGILADISGGKLTALMAGRGKIILTYQEDNDIFGDVGGAHLSTYEIPLIIIDEISLNMTSATMYVGSTLQLRLLTSNNAASIRWESEDESILTVNEDGLVTAVSPGTAMVTASQTIDGVTKYATCTIRVIAAVTKIVLDPSSKELAIGELLTINATVTPKLNNVKLYWVTSDEKIVSIEQSGDMSVTVKAQAGGTAVITAINQENVVVGSCLITVRQPIVSISLSQNRVTVPLSSKSFQLYATILPEAARGEEVLWKSTDPSIITVDQFGMVTLKKAGTASIICSAKSDGNISAICNVTVTKSVTGIKLDQTTLNIAVGESFRLTYEVTPQDAANVSVTWTSTNPGVATVDAKGLVRGRSVGQAAIILKTVDGGYMTTCLVTVERAATGVKLDVKSLTLNTGDYYIFETTITPADSTDRTLSWESSDPKVAIISNKGKVTAKSAGVAIILVQTKGGSSAYCTVTVQQGVTSVEIDSEEETIYVGDEVELGADVLPASATITDVTWSSSKSSVARIDKEGVVRGISPGVAIITCTTVDGGYVDYCVITVEEREVEAEEIVVQPESCMIGIGERTQLTATVLPSNATNQAVTWSSDSPDIVTVDEKGRIRGISAGTAVITCEAADGSGAEGYCEVEVYNQVTNINLNYDYLDMVVGESEVLTATILPEDATYGVHWESEDSSIAMVNRTTGKVTALKAGDTRIFAVADDTSGMNTVCFVRVKNPVPTTNIQVSESEIVMIPGETKTVSFTILPAGHTDSYEWSSDNPVVADVDSRTGLITANGMGTANITIFSESGRTASVKVYVVGLSKTMLTLQQYTSTIISLEVYGAAQSDLDVRWYSDNERIAEVARGRITARAIGTTYVYAVVNGRLLPCRVTVERIRNN